MKPSRSSQNFMNNRMHMAKHPSQGKAKKVLCVCTGGLLRSPTTAWVLSNPPYNYNTRSAGLKPEYALTPVDDVLIHWADEIVCMTNEHLKTLKKKFDISKKKVTCLGLSDDYLYRDPRLIKEIKSRYKRG